MKPMLKALLALLLAPLIAVAAETGARLDHSPHQPTDLVSLQAGARTYVNYCLGGHSLSDVRNQRGGADRGIGDEQIRSVR